MKIIKIILALVVIAISAYDLITKDFLYGPISSLLLGIFIAIIGIEEFENKGKNSWGMFFIPVSLLVIAVALFSF
ncbi:hypothetical protein ABE042_16030 [Viridibacillus arvi]|uniref:DUF3953 domain-containing protein n=1 Tax=Viridibacillus arvi TaxID=263475 RepID=A0A0M0LEM2_9BACL|nr:hypothetical protein [Viridibacillus arvi]KOO49163.1 hypothetical protein AMD00_12305 [Viridibacillus arvi]